MTNTILLRNVRVPRGGAVARRDVVVEGGSVARVADPGSLDLGPPFVGDGASQMTAEFDVRGGGKVTGGGLERRTVQAERLLLLPAFVDPHVHVREPGYDHKEDWETCSRAALKGGAACIFDMPNNKIPVTTAELLAQKREIALRKSLVSFGLYIALTDDNCHTLGDRGIQEAACGIKVYLAETTGKIVVGSERALQSAFQQPKPVLVHTGGVEGLSRVISFYGKAERHVAERPVLYICHVSTSEELALIRRTKRKCPRLLAEVTPHHLLLDAGSYGGYPGVLPPLSTGRDIEALWEGVADGTIDILGTDHAPHTVQEKESEKPPSGFPGVETAMPLMLTAFEERKLPLERLLDLVSRTARRLFSLGGQGIIVEGEVADIALFEEGEYRVGDDGYETKCGWSPFEGRNIRFRAVLTMVGGHTAYERAPGADDWVVTDPFSKPPIRNVCAGRG